MLFRYVIFKKLRYVGLIDFYNINIYVLVQFIYMLMGKVQKSWKKRFVFIYEELVKDSSIKVIVYLKICMKKFIFFFEVFVDYIYIRNVIELIFLKVIYFFLEKLNMNEQFFFLKK